MTTSLELVALHAPTDDQLRAAVTRAWAHQGRATPQLVGALAGYPMVEVATDDLELQVFPAFRRTTLAGPRWVTAMAVAASASDELVMAVMGAVNELASLCEGHLTVDGEVVELDGVRPPTSEELTVQAPRPGSAEPSPHPPVFAAVMLDVPTPDDDGFRSLLDALETWAGSRRDWLPRWWRPQEEWEAFDPDGPPPPWWPMEAELSTGGGVAAWTLHGAGFPLDVFSQVDAELRVPVDSTDELLAGLARLGPWHPAYAMVHPWHEQEPFVASGPRRGRPGEGPYLSLSAELLTSGLPNLYWGNLLGEPWVGAIGAERIATAPAYRVEEVLPGRWVLQLTARPSDVLDDWEGFSTLRERVKEHLGPDLFRREDGLDRLAPWRLPLPTLGERGLAR